MNTRNKRRLPAILLAFLAALGVCYGFGTSKASAQTCNHSLTNAQGALAYWQGKVGAFHSDLDGDNLVSYRELIVDWGTPWNDTDPARELGVCGLETFRLEVNAFPGVPAREGELIDALFETARSEMLLGNEDLIEVLDQEHLEAIQPDNPIAETYALTEEIKLLEGPRTTPIDTTFYGTFPQGRRDIIGRYAGAVNIFLQALDGEGGYEAFANRDYSTGQDGQYLDELTAPALRTITQFARASARKLTAYKELADRQFIRDYDRTSPRSSSDAIRTSLVASQAAYFEAVWLAAITPQQGLSDLFDTKDYRVITENLREMANIRNNITRGLNPFGYEPSFVPFISDPSRPDNNYQQMDANFLSPFLDAAEVAITRARDEIGQPMRDRVRSIEKDYASFQQMVLSEDIGFEGVRAHRRLEMAHILGYGSVGDNLDNDQDGVVNNPEEEIEPDLVSYFTNDSGDNKGTIGQLRLQLKIVGKEYEHKVEEIGNLEQEIQDQVSLLKRLLEINHEYIVGKIGVIEGGVIKKVKIIEDTGNAIAGLEEEVARLRARAAEEQGLLDGITKVVSSVAAVVATVYTGGAAAPSLLLVLEQWQPDQQQRAEIRQTAGSQAGQVADEIATGILGGIGSYLNGVMEGNLHGDLGSIEARKIRAEAYSNAKLAIVEGNTQIELTELDGEVSDARTNAEFDTHIRALMRSRLLKDIELEMAYLRVKEKTVALHSEIKRAIRIVADRNAFEEKVAELQELREFYQDPAARVLNDGPIIEAAKRFRRATEALYLTGKAMEYEVNKKYPDLVDSVFKLRTVEHLSDLRLELKWEHDTTEGILNRSTDTRILSLRIDLLGLDYDERSNARFRE